MADQIGLNEAEMKKLIDTIGRFSFGPEDRFNLAKKIGTALVQSTKLRFKDSIDPDGHPWLPLQSFRLRARDREGISSKVGRRRVYSKDQHPKPLVDTGRLSSSITYVATAQYVDVGTSVAYAAVHNFGSGRIPQRRFLGISEKDKSTIDLITRTEVKKMFESVFRGGPK